MKKRLSALCLTGVLSLSLLLPTSAAYIGNFKPSDPLPSSPVIQQYPEDAAGTLSFANIGPRMRENNPTILSIQSALDGQYAFNREEAYRILIDKINKTVDDTIAANGGSITGLSSMLSSNVSAMKDQLEQINEKNYAETLEKVERKLFQSMSLLVVGGQSLYLGTLSMENSLRDLKQTASIMERSLAAMELRYSLGQISKLQLQEFKTTYTTTKNGVSSMEASVEKMKASLESMVGAPITGKLTLLPISELSKEQKQVASMDYDAALTQAKEKSYTLFDAKNTLKDAEDDWKDARRDNSPAGYTYKMAEKEYESAVYTYESTVKTYELDFYNLYHSLPTVNGTVEAKREAYQLQASNYEAAKLKHSLGTLSDSALLKVEGELLAAKTALDTAEIERYTAYQNYFLAVNDGILNSEK